MTYGISNDILQPIFFGFGGLVFCALVWFIFIRKDRTFEVVYQAFAARTGLTYVPPRDVGSMTVGWETSILRGQLEGVQVQLMAHYLANSRKAGVNGRSSFQGRARVPANVAFTISIAPGGRAGTGQRVTTGDMRFDGAFLVESDHPAAAAMLLDPSVRACLFARPEAWSHASLRYDRGTVDLEFPDFAYRPEQLDYGFRVLVCACSARLA